MPAWLECVNASSREPVLFACTRRDASFYCLDRCIDQQAVARLGRLPLHALVGSGQCRKQTKQARSGDVEGVQDEIYTVLVHTQRNTHCHLALAALPLCAVLSE